MFNKLCFDLFPLYILFLQFIKISYACDFNLITYNVY
jgi:hypothetical protein